MEIRIDLVFSYWVYIWYIIYILKLIKYSPKFAILMGLIDNIILLYLMLIYGTSKYSIFVFIFINMFIKVVPLYNLRNENIILTDVYFTIFLFIVFIFWLYINKKTLVVNMKLIYYSIIYEKEQTPFFYFLHQIKKYIKNM